MLLEVQALDDLVEAVRICWQEAYPYRILGGGSNVLVSEAGIRGLVIINRARQVIFDEQSDPVRVRAESGANFGLVARQAASKGLAGLEWAVGIPGTVGGAVVGNAGAHGGDMAAILIMVEILHRKSVGQSVEAQRVELPVEELEYGYRSSVLKRQPGENVVLSAQMALRRSRAQDVQTKLDDLVAFRRRAQPPGASMGSMFKNPPGDYAGRLIEAAGLKGYRLGDAQISPLHANFFINLGNASARDIYRLIEHARQTVAEKSGISLELEVELIGEW